MHKTATKNEYVKTFIAFGSQYKGPDAIQSALKELEQHGYLARHRQRDEKGRMACTVFEIYEKPQVTAPHVNNPHRENHDVDNPPVDNPRGENPAQSNTYKTNTKKSNTDSINHPSLGDRADEMSCADFEKETSNLYCLPEN